MVFHGFGLVSIVSSRWFQGGFMVFGWFPWFFKVVTWFLMVFGWFPCFFKVVSWFFMVFGRFHGFSRWFHGFCLVSLVFQGGVMVFNWFPWFLRFPGGFSLLLMVPGWLNPS